MGWTTGPPGARPLRKIMAAPRQRGTRESPGRPRGGRRSFPGGPGAPVQRLLPSLFSLRRGVEDCHQVADVAPDEDGPAKPHLLGASIQTRSMAPERRSQRDGIEVLPAPAKAGPLWASLSSVAVAVAAAAALEEDLPHLRRAAGLGISEAEKERDEVRHLLVVESRRFDVPFRHRLSHGRGVVPHRSGELNDGWR